MMTWKPVAITYSVVEAAMMAARLESAGIPARSHQEAGGSALGLTVGPFGEITILVPETMVEQALAMLEGMAMTQEELFTSDYFRLHELADGVYAAISRSETGGAGSNAGFVDLGNSVLVFDALMLPRAARDLLAAVDKLTGNPARILVNSHAHPDHIYGNGIFPAETLIVATPTTRENIVAHSAEYLKEDKKELPGFIAQLQKELKEASDDATRRAVTTRITLYSALLETIDEVAIRPPEMTFKGHVTFYGSERSVELVTYGRGHTDGDAFLYLPEERILFSGDLLFAKTHPYLPGSIPEAWRTTLDKLLALDIETIVPGHGDLAGLEDLRTERDYLEALEKLVRQVIAQGGTADDAARVAIPAEYAAWDGARRFPDSMRFLFERLSEGGQV